jgi:hypothetical protein
MLNASEAYHSHFWSTASFVMTDAVKKAQGYNRFTDSPQASRISTCTMLCLVKTSDAIEEFKKYGNQE